MDKNVINFVIEATTSGVDAAGKSISEIKQTITGVATASKTATTWLGRFKLGLKGILTVFGPLTQIITFAMTVWQMFKERADKAAEAAREALEKQKERLNNMAEALKNWTNSLKETADLQERLEKERLITAEYEARTKAVKEVANAPFDKGLIFLFFFGIMLRPQPVCGKLLIFGNHESATLY